MDDGDWRANAEEPYELTAEERADIQSDLTDLASMRSSSRRRA